MRILLVNPPKLNSFRRLHFGLPPLGIAYLAAALRQAGHHVRIADLDVAPDPAPNFSQYDLVGISADTIGYPAALAVASAAKEAGTPVLMGGYHVSFQDEEALRSGVVDYVIRGEAEEPIVRLASALEGRIPWEAVSSLSFLQDDRLVRTPAARPVADLDALPLPARDLLPMRQYSARFRGRQLTSVITSRGCPFACSFCASSRFAGVRWRSRSPASIADEVERLQEEMGYRAVAFVDDNFTLDPQRVLGFADEVERRALDIIWWCFSRADTIVKNEAMVRRMAEAGCRQVFLGLESAAQEILEGYGKHLNVSQQRQALAILRRHGIKVHGAFIIGHPADTRSTIRQTIEQALNLGLYVAQFSILTPYPGTALFDEAVRDGRLLHTDWNLYDGLHAVMRADHLAPRELQLLLLRAYRRFYLRPHQVVSELWDALRFREHLGVELGRLVAFLSLRANLRSYIRRLGAPATT
jgi:anaerobic magnesium-protoporphyrin IX monomethyl ester cyclase